MTAINVFLKNDRAFVVTDALGYNVDGEAMGIYPKCLPIAHIGAAVATRGTAIWTGLLAGAFGLKFESFDDLVEDGGDVAADVYHTCRDLNYSGESAVQIVIAGWSTSRQAMETYFLTSVDQPGREAWRFYQGEPVTVAPEPSIAALKAFGLAGKGVDDLDPRIDSVALLNAQRAMKFATTSDGENIGVHIVGGHVLLTEISRDAVTQSVLHRWTSDREGELVRPDIVIETQSLRELLDEDLDDGEAPAPRPMSRQERRAAARVARHGGRR